MAKGKKKGADAEDAAGGLDESEQAILTYMNAQNRPYGAQDIFMNLHQAIGKTQVARALASLQERSLLAGKTYGKTVIYVARQDEQPAPSAEELAALDTELTERTAAVAALRDTVRELQSRANALNATLKTSDMRVRIDELRAQEAAQARKLAALKTGAAAVDPEEKKRVDRQCDAYLREWRLRRRLCVDAVRAIAENLPQSPTAFMEELGMEQDAVPPPK